MINKILKIYKEDEEQTYREILNSKLLSQIVQNFEKIKRLEEDLSGDQKKQLASSEKKEKINLQNDLIKFIPVAIRLAKHPTNITESKHALEILKEIPNISEEEKAEKINTEITKETKKYEEQILSKIESQKNILIVYKPSLEALDQLLKNLKIAAAQPISDEDKIDGALKDLGIEEASEKYTGLEKALLLLTRDNIADPGWSDAIEASDLTPEWKPEIKKEVAAPFPTWPNDKKLEWLRNKKAIVAKQIRRINQMKNIQPQS